MNLTTPENISGSNIPQKKRTIKEFSKNKIIFSDGTVLTSETGEFDQAVIEAILKAGD